MKRPALGHLLGYTALTVVLTAGAAQSLAGANTVFSDDIVDAQVKLADIGAGAVGSSEIVDNSIRSADIGNDLITGDDVNESTMTPTCPLDMDRVGDVCYTEQQPELTLTSAALACADSNLRLPGFSEGHLVANEVATSTHIWTANPYFDDTNSFRAVTTNGNGVDFNVAAFDTKPYRCVTTVGARP